jgi:hypothetical protein
MRGDWPVTGLSLEEWRMAMGWHPYHFWGMADNDALAVTAQCDAVVYGYAWQMDQIAGRYEITQAIARAEQKLLQELHYRPAPVYTEATLPWPPLGDPRMARLGPADAQGRWLPVNLPEGEVRAIGTESRTLIGNTAVTLSDSDGDEVNDRFTATIATSVTDVTEIACYFVAADRLNGDEVSERYRIRPLDVQIAGGVATIRGPAWLLVRPVQSEGFRQAPKNPNSAGVLATQIAVYRRTTDASSTAVATSQAVITWETRPCHGWWCCCGCQDTAAAYAGSPYDPAATAQAVARAGIRNARTGTVFAAEAAYDATSGTWSALDWLVCTQPDRVTVRYLAGRPLSNFRVDGALAQVTARLAAAELGRPICACDNANREIYRWQVDLAFSGPNDETYQIGPGDLDNPYGTRRGHVEAWRFVQAQRRLRGTTI